MPDIAMCMKATCPRSHLCYRFTATPSEWLQSYGQFNCNETDADTDWFWPNDEAAKQKSGKTKESRKNS